MIRVFIADDHAVIRDGLTRILEEADDMECAGQVEDGAEVLDALDDTPFDVLVLDLSLPGGGEETLQRVKMRKPDLPVIIFSMHPEDSYALHLLKTGASAYISKGRSTMELLKAIRKVHQGRKYVTQELAELLLEHKDAGEEMPHERLSDRERQVFMLLLDGRSPSEIVDELLVSASTVSTHIQRIKQKLEVNSVVEMVKYAYRVGILH